MRMHGTVQDTQNVIEWQNFIKQRVIELALQNPDHELSVSDIQEKIMSGELPTPPHISDDYANQGGAFLNLLRNFGFKPTKKLVASKFPPSKGRKVAVWYLPWEEMCSTLDAKPEDLLDDVWLV